MDRAGEIWLPRASALGGGTTADADAADGDRGGIASFAGIWLGIVIDSLGEI